MTAGTASIRGVLCDGVWLSTRTGRGRLAAMIRVVNGLAEMYQSTASYAVESIDEDDKNCAFYEVRLVDGVPVWIARDFAKEIRDLFRVGGYNGLIIYHRDVRLIDDDPWWDFD